MDRQFMNTERNETIMLRPKGKHRKVCERCLTITTNDQCPQCGHDHLRKFIFMVQAGRKNQLYKADVG